MNKKIDSFVRDNSAQMLEDIKKIVAVRSVKGNPEQDKPYGPEPAAALECMEEIVKEHGLSTRNVDGYMLEVNLNDKPDGLGILCHLDVVHEGSGWTTPPYEMDIRDGRIYGRGVADNKGPAIASLYAMKCVRELGIDLNKNVRLMLGTDEECGSSDLVEYWKRATPPPYCFSPDAAFPVYNIEKGRFGPHFTAAFEESLELPRVIRISGGNAVNIVPDEAEAEIEGMDIETVTRLAEDCSRKLEIKFSTEEKGGRILIKAKGVSTHASYPEDGNNALTGILALIASMPMAGSEGFEYIKAAAELLPHGDWLGEAAGIKMSDELSGPLTCNLGTFEYTVSSLDGGIDIRSPICGGKENVALAMEKNFGDRGMDLSTTDMVLPHHVPEELPFIQTLMHHFEDVTGIKGECLAMGGGTYVHGMKNSVAFGAAFPDTDTFAHAPDEYAIIEELEACVKIFARIIIDMCK